MKSFSAFLAKGEALAKQAATQGGAFAKQAAVQAASLVEKAKQEEWAKKVSQSVNEVRI